MSELEHAASLWRGPVVIGIGCAVVAILAPWATRAAIWLSRVYEDYWDWACACA